MTSRSWTPEVASGYTLLEWGLAMALVVGLLLQPTLGHRIWGRQPTWLHTMNAWLSHGRFAALVGGQVCHMRVVFRASQHGWFAVMQCGHGRGQVRATGLGRRWHVVWQGNRGLPGLWWLPNGHTAAQQGHWCVVQDGSQLAEAWYVSQGGRVRRVHQAKVCQGLGLRSDFAKLTTRS